MLSDRAEIPQQADLGFVQPSRASVDDAERAHAALVGENERATRIEADARFAGHKRIVCEAGVEEGVGNDHDALAEDGMRTKGDLA